MGCKIQSATLKNAEGETDSSHGTATIGGSNSDTITAKINLAYPGDGVILEAVVVNNGNTPAILKNISIDGPDSGDIEVTKSVSGPVNNEELTSTEEPQVDATVDLFRGDATVEAYINNPIDRTEVHVNSYDEFLLFNII